MPQNRYFYLLVTVLCALVISGCERNKTVCLPEEETPRATLQLEDLISLPAPASTVSEPMQVVIGGKPTAVNKLVDYPLCNDNWSGTVYVSCDVQVAEAELDADSNPLFLKGCNLRIAPSTVVYVAAHNDAPYYKGCSCHTGAAPQP